jgi:hypothetical protein
VFFPWPCRCFPSTGSIVGTKNIPAPAGTFPIPYSLLEHDLALLLVAPLLVLIAALLLLPGILAAALLLAGVLAALLLARILAALLLLIVVLLRLALRVVLVLVRIVIVHDYTRLGFGFAPSNSIPDRVALFLEFGAALPRDSEIGVGMQTVAIRTGAPGIAGACGPCSLTRFAVHDRVVARNEPRHIDPSMADSVR